MFTDYEHHPIRGQEMKSKGAASKAQWSKAFALHQLHWAGHADHASSISSQPSYTLSYCFSREKALKQKKNKANIRRVLVFHAHCITCCSLWIWNPWKLNISLQTEDHAEQGRATLAFALSTHPITTKSSTAVALSVTAPHGKNCLRDFKVYQHFCLLNYYFA